MKHRSNIVTFLILALVISCAREEYVLDPVEEDIIIVQPGLESDGTTIEAQASLFGALPSYSSDAFKARIRNVVDGFSEKSDVAICTMDALDSNLATMLNNGAVIVILNSVPDKLNQWLESNGSTLKFNDSSSLLAFTAYGHSYSMECDGEPSGSEEMSAQLNEFVRWANSILEPEDMSEVLEKSDLKNYISGTPLVYTKTWALSQKECAPAFSTEKYLNGSPSITVRNMVYPAYVLSGQAGHGDYYVVHSELSIANGNAYSEGFWKWGGVTAEYKGFYQKQLSITSRLTDKHGSATGVFAQTPKPETTIGVSTVSSGVDWKLSSSVRYNAGLKDTTIIKKEDMMVAFMLVFDSIIVDEGGEYVIHRNGQGASINAGMSFKNSKTYTLSDVSVTNNSDGLQTVSYNLDFNNLPYCMLIPIKLSECPSSARTTTTFISDWIWHVDSVNDYDTSTAFTMTTDIVDIHASCHFYSTRADFVENKQRTAYSFEMPMPVPSRFPTGKLLIQNTQESEYLSDLAIYNSDGEKIYFNDSDSISKYHALECLLIPGTYTIEMKIGANRLTADTYTNTRTVRIEHGKSIVLHSSYDFSKK